MDFHTNTSFKSVSKSLTLAKNSLQLGGIDKKSAFFWPIEKVSVEPNLEQVPFLLYFLTIR
ncbi:hypothetical protein D2V08_03190 [Flagellimonas lutimaris]|uniref:Uncharacterized protein n=1 Tax=Flagellimonas lutimaris TaxID=475082 RepID=A0A3A1NA80_9FLAO|nr:hypothetical protein D2V08_03190 [Allomuricauda lutimaris]